MVPAGARARSLARPFGLNFVFVPRSACLKGREKAKKSLAFAVHATRGRMNAVNAGRE